MRRWAAAKYIPVVIVPLQQIGDRHVGTIAMITPLMKIDRRRQRRVTILRVFAKPNAVSCLRPASDWKNRKA